jgi:hypothetical protein
MSDAWLLYVLFITGEEFAPALELDILFPFPPTFPLLETAAFELEVELALAS